MPSGVHNTSFNKSREAKYVSHKSRPAMQDMIPGLAPEPKMAFPFVSLGITERLRRPILDHVLLGTRQAYINENTDLTRTLPHIIFLLESITKIIPPVSYGGEHPGQNQIYYVQQENHCLICVMQSSDDLTMLFRCKKM
jgi:hypothetical protein